MKELEENTIEQIRTLLNYLEQTDLLKNNSDSPIALKKETKNKTKRVTKTIDSTTQRESDLLLF